MQCTEQVQPSVYWVQKALNVQKNDYLANALTTAMLIYHYKRLLQWLYFALQATTMMTFNVKHTAPHYFTAWIWPRIKWKLHRITWHQALPDATDSYGLTVRITPMSSPVDSCMRMGWRGSLWFCENPTGMVTDVAAVLQKWKTGVAGLPQVR